MITLTITSGGDTVATREFTDEDVRALLDALPGVGGIADWLSGALDGKIYAAKQDMAARAIAFFASAKIAPATLTDFSNDAFVRVMSGHPDYKDRAARDAEQTAKLAVESAKA